MSKKHLAVKLSKVISYILVLLLIIGLCGFLAYFTNGFTTDFQTFYLEYDGAKILEKADSIVFEQSKEFRIGVNYTFGKVNKDVRKDYTVKIVPKITDKVGSFDFTVDGEVRTWSSDLDLTEVFRVQKYDDYFTLATSGVTSMNELLSRCYVGQTIVCPDVSLSNECMKIVVTSYNGKATVEIAFSLLIPVTGVELSDSEWVVYEDSFK